MDKSTSGVVGVVMAGRGWITVEAVRLEVMRQYGYRPSRRFVRSEASRLGMAEGNKGIAWPDEIPPEERAACWQRMTNKAKSMFSRRSRFRQRCMDIGQEFLELKAEEFGAP